MVGYSQYHNGPSSYNIKSVTTLSVSGQGSGRVSILCVPLADH